MNSTNEANAILTSNRLLPSKILLTIVGGAIVAGVFLKTIFSKKKVAVEDDEPNPLAIAPSGSKFIELPKSGVTLRYVDDIHSDSNFDTKQVTFLLVHGFAGVLETWEFLTPYLLGGKTNTRVVALDLVGSGFSDKPDGANFDYAYRSQGSVVSEFISIVGLSNVVIVGHSSGSVVAASTALQNTNNVIGVVFIANALFRAKSKFYSKPWLRPLFRWMVTKMMADRKKSLEKMHLPTHADRVLTESFVEKFAAPTRLPNFNDALIEGVMVAEDPYEDLVDELLSLPTSPNRGVESDKEKTPLPLLFVYGKQDTYKPLPNEQKEFIRQKMNDMDAERLGLQRIDIIELEECHHYAQHEQPEALAQGILAFVETM